MMRRNVVVFCCTMLVLLAASRLPAADQAKKNARLLMLTQSAGYRHESVNRKDAPLSPAERAITDLGVASNLFRADCTQDARAITKEQLDGYDIVLFYTTGDLPFTDEVRDYLFGAWVKQRGHGFIGTHSAADTYHNYEPYWEMLGGTFDGHPWGSDQTVTVTVHDTKHPISKPWGEEFTIQDEIYQFKHWQPEKVRVLMSLNMAKTKLKKPFQVPIAWVKNYGEGKVLHMSLGHREEVWVNEKYMQSLLGGIKWMLGQEAGDATPNPDLSSAQEAKARSDFDAAESAQKVQDK